MKGHRKTILKSIIFGLGLFLLICRISEIFMLKEYSVGANVNALISPYNLCEKQDGFYSKQKNTLDVVFIGSSNIHCNINPNVIWNQYGITSYNFSSDQQELGTSYYYLQQVFESQSPSVIVIDIMGNGNTDSIEDLAAHFAFDHMKFDRIKLAAIFDRTIDSRIEMLFPLITYHERWKELKKDDYIYSTGQPNLLNGAFIYMLQNEQETPQIPEKIPFAKLPERTKYWLDSILELCKKNGSKCVFIKTPYAFYEESWYSYFEAIQRYCEEKDVPFLYMNKKVDEIGIDFKTDYADTMHMNWNGQLKLSIYIGRYLTQNYYIADKRSDPTYSAWNDDYKKMMYYVDNFWTLYWDSKETK